MSDYLYRLEVPADKCSFTVAEALEATSSALHPDSDAEGQVSVDAISKVTYPPGRPDCASFPTPLADADWQVLLVIWAGMVKPQFPMPKEQWQPYLDAFNASPNRPDCWHLIQIVWSPRSQTDLRRAATHYEHFDLLKMVVTAGDVVVRNPMTGRSGGLNSQWLLSEDDAAQLMTRDQLRAFCALLAIELVEPPPNFVTSARPLEVPAALLALSDDESVTYEYDMAGLRKSGRTTAADYRASIRDTMARQAEGHFTLNEAAQVLADSRPGLDPMETVKRFRLAHSKGELPIHQGGSRFPLEVGETVRDFWDTVEVGELDAWLRRSAAHGFPHAPTNSMPATTMPETPKQKRTSRDVDDDWHELARDEARRIINRQSNMDCFPSQKAIANEIADTFRKHVPPIYGADGKPLSGATIKRHALKGITSAAKKARSTTFNRGK